MSELRRVAKLLADISPDLTIRAVQLFCEVAAFPGRSMSEYAEMTRMPASTTSRLLLGLSGYPRSKVRPIGAGLITRDISPDSLRQNVYGLSAAGQRLLDDITRPDP